MTGDPRILRRQRAWAANLAALEQRAASQRAFRMPPEQPEPALESSARIPAPAAIGSVSPGSLSDTPELLRREVAVPADAISLTFSGYAWVSQPDLGEPLADWAVLQVEDPNPASNGIWQIRHTVPVVSFWVPNAAGTLSVWLDSLGLEARCPR